MTNISGSTKNIINNSNRLALVSGLPVNRYSPRREFLLILLITVLHAPLGIILYSFPLATVIHPLAVLVIGLYFAFENKPESPLKVVYAIAYLTGVEVLWRMSNSPVFWEFGKYAIVLIMLVAIAKRGFQKVAVLPLVYFILLVPSCILTLLINDFDQARSQLSSNMSGPLSLFVSCWFFSGLTLNWIQIRRVFFALMIPALSVAVATLFYIANTPEISFNTESNHATSGGFGPNQVSSALGLGAFAALMCLILMNNHHKFKIYFVISTIFLAAQSVLTFSRGGIYNVVGAILIVGVMQVKDFKKALNMAVPLVLITTLFALFVFPLLNNFTGGMLQERFESTDSSNRLEIVESDVQILLENPLLGIGVGEAKYYRKQIFSAAVASHTEFSRLVSEHGLFGVAALIVLFLTTIINFNRQKTNFGKALVIGAVAWSSLYMLNSGMRLAAPALMWGISFVTVVRLQTNHIHLIRQQR